MKSDRRKIIFSSHHAWGVGVAGQDNLPPTVHVDSQIELIEAEGEAQQRRHCRQRDALEGVWDPTGAPLFDPDPVKIAYRRYQMRRLGNWEQPRPQGGLLALDHDVPWNDRLYLFNVLVALEWTPSDAYLAQLRRAFRRASDFLYDVTDGLVAFGQVLFGGPDMMEGADIQIMVSNRFHPRSWVAGLHEEEKFLPIRLGRGLWHSRDKFTIDWDEAEGYRTIIHEWLHYALWLKDRYLTDVRWDKDSFSFYREPRVSGARQSDNAFLRGPSGPCTLRVPAYSITNPSVMGALPGRSELWGPQRAAPLQEKLPSLNGVNKSLADDLRAKLTDTEWLGGPSGLPLPLPHFYSLFDSAEVTAAQSLSCRLPENNNETSTFPREHSWVYLLKTDGAGGYRRLVPHGTLDNPWERETFSTEYEPLDLNFEVRDAAACDKVLLVVERWARPARGQDNTRRTRTNEEDCIEFYCATVENSKASQGSLQLGKWKRINEESMPPVVVLPMGKEDEKRNSQLPSSRSISVTHLRQEAPGIEGDGTALSMNPDPVEGDNSDESNTTELTANRRVSVILEDQHAANEVWLFPLGIPFKGTNEYGKSISPKTPTPVPTLDGHVLARWGDEGVEERLMIAPFSQGGGPATHSGVGPNPTTAGSADGHVMVFFPPMVDANAGEQLDGELSKRLSKVKITTTLIHAKLGKRPDKSYAGSYTYALAAAERLPVPEDWPSTERPLPTMPFPALVLFYQPLSLDDDPNRYYRPCLYRLCGDEWKCLLTYAPPAVNYAAALLTPDDSACGAGTAPGLYDERKRYEIFRLFWVPVGNTEQQAPEEACD